MAWIISTIIVLLLVRMIVSLRYNNPTIDIVRADEPHHSPEFDIQPDPDSAVLQLLYDTISYRRYAAKRDSINWMTQSAMTNFLGGAQDGVFGTAEADECDTCDILYPAYLHGEPLTRKKYFIQLPGRYLITQDTFLQHHYTYLYHPIFYSRRGKVYKKYIQMDSLTHHQQMFGKRLEQWNEYHGHWTSKEIHYRVAQLGLYYGPESRTILVETSKRIYWIRTVLYYIEFFVSALLVFRYVLIGFFSILVRLARGQAFSPRTYRELLYMSLVILAFPVLDIVPTLVTHLIYGYTFTGDMELDLDWSSDLKFLIAAVAIFLIANAFKKGYRLQQEHELTV